MYRESDPKKWEAKMLHIVGAEDREGKRTGDFKMMTKLIDLKASKIRFAHRYFDKLFIEHALEYLLENRKAKSHVPIISVLYDRHPNLADPAMFCWTWWHTACQKKGNVSNIIAALSYILEQTDVEQLGVICNPYTTNNISSLHCANHGPLAQTPRHARFVCFGKHFIELLIRKSGAAPLPIADVGDTEPEAILNDLNPAMAVQVYGIAKLNQSIQSDCLAALNEFISDPASSSIVLSLLMYDTRRYLSDAAVAHYVRQTWLMLKAVDQVTKWNSILSDGFLHEMMRDSGMFAGYRSSSDRIGVEWAAQVSHILLSLPKEYGSNEHLSLNAFWRWLLKPETKELLQYRGRECFMALLRMTIGALAQETSAVGMLEMALGYLEDYVLTQKQMNLLLRRCLRLFEREGHMEKECEDQVIAAMCSIMDSMQVRGYVFNQKRGVVHVDAIEDSAFLYTLRNCGNIKQCARVLRYLVEKANVNAAVGIKQSGANVLHYVVKTVLHVDVVTYVLSEQCIATPALIELMSGYDIFTECCKKTKQTLQSQHCVVAQQLYDRAKKDKKLWSFLLIEGNSKVLADNTKLVTLCKRMHQNQMKRIIGSMALEPTAVCQTHFY